MRIDPGLPQQTEATLQREAERRGLTLEAYITRIIDGLMNLADLVTPLETETQSERSESYHDTIDDIIDETVLELKENQLQTRERVVKVITQKNTLLAEYSQRSSTIETTLSLDIEADFERWATNHIESSE